jgi:hypothetical protein
MHDARLANLQLTLDIATAIGCFDRRVGTASPSHLHMAMCASQERGALAGKLNRYIG